MVDSHFDDVCLLLILLIGAGERLGGVVLHALIVRHHVRLQQNVEGQSGANTVSSFIYRVSSFCTVMQQ